MSDVDVNKGAVRRVGLLVLGALAAACASKVTRPSDVLDSAAVGVDASELVLFEDTLYWTVPDVEVRRIDLVTGEASALITEPSYGISVDATSVYAGRWFEENDEQRYYLGAFDRFTGEEQRRWERSGAVLDTLVLGDELMWSTCSFFNAVSLVDDSTRGPLLSGCGMHLYAVDRTVASTYWSWTTLISVDGTNDDSVDLSMMGVLASDGRVFYGAREQYESTRTELVRIEPDGTVTTSLLAKDEGVFTAAAVDGEDLYYAWQSESGEGHVGHIDFARQGATVLADRVAQPSALAVDAQFVYYVEASDNETLELKRIERPE